MELCGGKNLGGKWNRFRNYPNYICLLHPVSLHGPCRCMMPRMTLVLLYMRIHFDRRSVGSLNTLHIFLNIHTDLCFRWWLLRPVLFIFLWLGTDFKHIFLWFIYELAYHYSLVADSPEFYRFSFVINGFSTKICLSLDPPGCGGSR